MYAKKERIKNKRRGGMGRSVDSPHRRFCLWKNSAVVSTCWCFYACDISFHIPPTSWFCNSCVYTTLALLRSLTFSGNKATNIPVKCWALASCLSFPLLFYKPGHTMTSGSCQRTSRNQPLCRAGGGTVVNLCLFVLEDIQHWKKPYFELFQISYRHFCNLAEMGL